MEVKSSGALAAAVNARRDAFFKEMRPIISQIMHNPDAFFTGLKEQSDLVSQQDREALVKEAAIAERLLQNPSAYLPESLATNADVKATILSYYHPQLLPIVYTARALKNSPNFAAAHFSPVLPGIPDRLTDDMRRDGYYCADSKANKIDPTITLEGLIKLQPLMGDLNRCYSQSLQLALDGFFQAATSLRYPKFGVKSDTNFTLVFLYNNDLRLYFFSLRNLVYTTEDELVPCKSKGTADSISAPIIAECIMDPDRNALIAKRVVILPTNLAVHKVFRGIFDLGRLPLDPIDLSPFNLFTQDVMRTSYLDATTLLNFVTDKNSKAEARIAVASKKTKELTANIQADRQAIAENQQQIHNLKIIIGEYLAWLEEQRKLFAADVAQISSRIKIAAASQSDEQKATIEPLNITLASLVDKLHKIETEIAALNINQKRLGTLHRASIISHRHSISNVPANVTDSESKDAAPSGDVKLNPLSFFSPNMQLRIPKRRSNTALHGDAPLDFASLTMAAPSASSANSSISHAMAVESLSYSGASTASAHSALSVSIPGDRESDSTTLAEVKEEQTTSNLQRQMEGWLSSNGISFSNIAIDLDTRDITIVLRSSDDAQKALPLLAPYRAETTMCDNTFSIHITAEQANRLISASADEEHKVYSPHT